MKIRLNCLIICVFTLLLTGCISMRAPKTPSYQYVSAQERVAKLKQMTAWNLQGAVSIRQAKRTDIAQVTWHQQGQKYYVINISGPLSLGAVRLIGRPGKVTFMKSAKERYFAKTPEILMQKQLGWQLPVSNLYYWIRGLPNLHLQAKTEYDRFGHLIKLSQQGWVIDYLRFQRIEDVDLPSLMTMQNQRMKIKLVIQQWQMNDDVS